MSRNRASHERSGQGLPLSYAVTGGVPRPAIRGRAAFIVSLSLFLTALIAWALWIALRHRSLWPRNLTLQWPLWIMLWGSVISFLVSVPVSIVIVGWCVTLLFRPKTKPDFLPLAFAAIVAYFVQAFITAMTLTAWIPSGANAH